MVSIDKEIVTINKIKSILNYFFIFTLIVIPTIFGFLKMPTEMGISIPGIAVALFFINLDKFKRFKGAGIEAEMQEAVRSTYAAIEQLKELALTLASPIVDTLAVSGKMLQYITLKHKLENVEQIKEALRKLGASESEIKKSCSTIHERVISDHVRCILNYIKIANQDKPELFNDYENWDFYEWDKSKIDSFIKDHSLVLNDESKEWILDLDYFLANNQLRREENWQM